MEDVTAGPDDAGQRLDRFLAAALDGTVSRSRLKALIEDGRVTVNDTVVREPRRSMRKGDVARIDLPPAGFLVVCVESAVGPVRRRLLPRHRSEPGL